MSGSGQRQAARSQLGTYTCTRDLTPLPRGRPRLRLPPAGDAVAINAVLLAAVQHLALTGEARPGTGGVALDEAGWARIEAALDALLAAFPD